MHPRNGTSYPQNYRDECNGGEDIFNKPSIFFQNGNDFVFMSVVGFQCKEWGFLLKKLFGHHLGTGDYGHLVVDHSAMLLRHFSSLYEYSGQGFELSHKQHRQLYSRATNLVIKK